MSLGPHLMFPAADERRRAEERERERTQSRSPEHVSSQQQCVVQQVAAGVLGVCEAMEPFYRL